MTPRHWIHDWKPFLIQFSDTIGIRYYGLAYVLGFVGAAFLLVRYARSGRSQLPEAQVGDFMASLVVGVLLGGRLGYFLFYRFEEVVRNPMVLVRVWEGGMAFHGGLVGVLIALFWYARARKLPFLHLGDLVCTVAPFGLMLGRIANFINGELWGRVSMVRWAVIFPQSGTPGMPTELILPRHPSQLYEAALEGLLLLIYLQLRLWRSSTIKTHPGRLAGEYLVGYAVARVLCELFREPDASLIMGLSRGTFYSLAMVVFGLFLIVRRPRARS